MSVQGATKALCRWHIAEEQRRNALKMGLRQKGQAAFGLRLRRSSLA